MGRWEMVRLGDSATFINGYPFKPLEWATNGLPIIRIQNLTESSNVVNYYDKSYDTRYEVTDGDILISWSASLGVYEWKKGKALLNQHIFKVVFDKLEFDKSFFKYIVGQKIDDMGRVTHGSTMKHITKKYFDAIQISFPPLPVQQKIADILDRASALIEKRKAQIEKLDLLVKSQFVEMFGDPVTNPMGWDYTTLGSIAEISSSKRIFESEYVNTGIPFYRTKEIVELSKGISISTELYISHERYNEIKHNYNVPSVGDMLVSAVGTIGIIWVVNTNEPFYFKDGNLLWLRFRKQCNSVFMKYLLSTIIDYYKNDLTAGSAYNALTIIKLKQMETYNPPPALQNEFAAFVERVEAQKTQLKNSLELLELNYKSLMQKCFSGEIF